MALLITSNGFPQQAIQCASLQYAGQGPQTTKIDTFAFTVSDHLLSANEPATALTPPVINPAIFIDRSHVSISTAASPASVPGIARAANGATDALTTAGGGTSYTVAADCYAEVTLEWSFVRAMGTDAGFNGYAFVNPNSANGATEIPVVGTIMLPESPSGSDFQTARTTFRAKYSTGDTIDLAVASLGVAAPCKTMYWALKVEVLALL